jgi:hypothetical protein
MSVGSDSDFEEGLARFALQADGARGAYSLLLVDSAVVAKLFTAMERGCQRTSCVSGFPQIPGNPLGKIRDDHQPARRPTGHPPRGYLRYFSPSPAARWFGIGNGPASTTTWTLRCTRSIAYRLIDAGKVVMAGVGLATMPAAAVPPRRQDRNRLPDRTVTQIAHERGELTASFSGRARPTCNRSCQW